MLSKERAEEIRRRIWRNHGWVQVGSCPTAEESREICNYQTSLPKNTSYYDAVAKMARGEHLKEKVMENEEKRGTIVTAQAQGGMLELIVKDEKGEQHRLLGDNGPTVRALMSVFGQDIVRGHTLLVDSIKGREIGYTVDSLGLLTTISE